LQTAFCLPRIVPVKVKVAPRLNKSKSLVWKLGHPIVRAVVAAFLIVCLSCFGVFAFFYVKYQKIVDDRIRKPIFNNAAKIYASPEVVKVGDKRTTAELANLLRHAGYTEAGEQGASKIGTYVLSAGLITIRPGRESFHAADDELRDELVPPNRLWPLTELEAASHIH